MTELVACLSTGKGTWTSVIQLMKSQEWDRVYLITNEFGRSTFKPGENTELVVINENDDVSAMIDAIMLQLKDKIAGTEVALNMLSGTGKEHMATLSAILKMGLAVRLVLPRNNEIVEI